MLIAFDGIDGAGKSTQVQRLIEFLTARGRSVLSVRDPGSTSAGEAIRGLLLNSDLEMHRRCEAFLYMAARCQLVEERIRPALAEGRIVICDRYLLANVVYQSVAGGESAETLWELGQIATQGVRPDLTLLLDLPAELAVARLDRPADRMESRGLEYLVQVRNGFLEHVQRAGSRHAVIDASVDIEAMHLQIVKEVEKCLIE
jgi:dTMP kinase